MPRKSLRKYLAIDNLSNKPLLYLFIVIFMMTIGAGYYTGINLFEKEEYDLFSAKIGARAFFHVTIALDDTKYLLDSFERDSNVEHLERALFKLKSISGQLGKIESEKYIVKMPKNKALDYYYQYVDRVLDSVIDGVSKILFNATELEKYNISGNNLLNITRVKSELMNLRQVSLDFESSFWNKSNQVYSHIVDSFNTQRVVFILSMSCLSFFFFSFLFLLLLKIRSDKRLDSNNIELINNYRLANLGEFSANIAHEINNPLAIIILTLKRINRRGESSPFLDGQFKKIHTQVDRIGSIIYAIKKLSKSSKDLNNKEISIISLFESLENVVKSKCELFDIKLEIVGIDDGASIWGKSIQMVQVLTNFVTNSIEAIKDSPERWIKICYKTDGNYLVIRVIDSGRGIDIDESSKLFSYMFTTKNNGGLGIGLALSSQIIDSMDGNLKYLASERNTTFEVTLPLYKSLS